jgi:Family of unknown function (DUF6113)
MGTSQDSVPESSVPGSSVPGSKQPGSGQWVVTVAGYLVLFVLGVLEGLIGSFQYSQPPTPLIAIVLAAVIGVTCAAASWGMGSTGAGLLPAIGWIITSFALATSRPNGSVLFTESAAAEWYLYGGALASLAGALVPFFVRITRLAAPR